MAIVFLILVIVLSAVLGFVILVQNPKGGGLSASIGGIGNQFMGVKQTTDVLEKGTWIFATLVALLCLFSAFFIPNTAKKSNGLMDQINTKTNNTAPAPTPIAPNPANTKPLQPQK
jgi:preprotein translocase subunit SecG